MKGGAIRLEQLVKSFDGVPAVTGIDLDIPTGQFYSLLGAACYGFSPVKLEPHMPFGTLYHGNDERLPVEGFYWGLKVYAEVVLKFLGIKFDEVFS